MWNKNRIKNVYASLPSAASASLKANNIADIPHALVRGIALVPNAGHPHDLHAENPLHSQQGFMAAPAQHAGDCQGRIHRQKQI